MLKDQAEKVNTETNAKEKTETPHINTASEVRTYSTDLTENES